MSEATDDRGRAEGTCGRCIVQQARQFDEPRAGTLFEVAREFGSVTTGADDEHPHHVATPRENGPVNE